MKDTKAATPTTASLTPMPPEIAAMGVPKPATAPTVNTPAEPSQIIGRPPGALSQMASAERVQAVMNANQPRDPRGLFAVPSPLEVMQRQRVEQLRMTLGQLIDQTDRLAVSASAMLTELKNSNGGAAMAEREELNLERCGELLSGLDALLEGFAPKPAPEPVAAV